MVYEYSYKFVHSDISAKAQTEMNDVRSNRCCALTLGRRFNDNVISDREIRKCAFHEIMEVILWDIGDYMSEHVGQRKERDCTHKVTRIFENTIFVESYEKRFSKKFK